MHVVDVVGRRHVGYVGGLGFIPGPRGVAAKGALVAVSSCKSYERGPNAVLLYRGSGAPGWTLLRMIRAADGQPRAPFGLRFTADGSGVAVGDKQCLSLYRADDGSFVRHLATNMTGGRDLEEVNGTWVVLCGGLPAVASFAGDGGGERVPLGCAPERWRQVPPVALAWVPGLGLIVRDLCFVQVFATPGMIAMAAMSEARVSWMSACCRAILSNQ